MRPIFFLLISLLLGMASAGSELQAVATSGAGIRIGAFGVPTTLLDLFFYEHPKIIGTCYTFEIRAFGDKGPRSVFSGIYGFEYSHMKADGHWRINQNENRVTGGGEVTQLSVCATIILNIFPAMPLHPYMGGGVGLGVITIWADYSSQDSLGTTIRRTYDKHMVIPVIHIPVGIIFNIQDRIEARVEAGFKNGFYLAGSLAFVF